MVSLILKKKMKYPVSNPLVSFSSESFPKLKHHLSLQDETVACMAAAIDTAVEPEAVSNWPLCVEPGALTAISCSLSLSWGRQALIAPILHRMPWKSRNLECKPQLCKIPKFHRLCL